MSETNIGATVAAISPALVGVAQAAGRAVSEKARYENQNGFNQRSTSPIAGEDTLPGIELNNFTTREQTESGTHVLVTEHKEYLEAIPEPPEPPTEEELAAAREFRTLKAKLMAGVAATAIVVGGVLVALDKKGRKLA